MNKQTRRQAAVWTAWAAVASIGAMTPAWAGGLPAALQTRVDSARARLVQLAADPAVVAAVRDANGRDLGGMNNGKWSDLGDADPLVKAYTGNRISARITQWEAADTSVNKLVLRDQKGNLVGASTRPLVFNNASRPAFANPIKGQAWAADEVRVDPTTQVPSVHIGVPVLDGGKPIGVLHTALTSQ